MSLGTYILDTLQIYFPWDDDLYTFLKRRGLASQNSQMKVLPLIYSDNLASTQGVDRLKRNYIIDPVQYGYDENQLGWERIGKRNFSIPSEKPQLQILSQDGHIVFKIVPTVDGKHEYHIEYSVMSAFGKIYTNWVAFYLPLTGAQQLTATLYDSYSDTFNEIVVPPAPFVPQLNVETKQNQRERMHWAPVPVVSYCFSLSAFEYAAAYLRTSGVTGNLPALVFDTQNPKHLEVMNPVLKVGIVETTGQPGFRERNVQLVFKLAQDKIIIGQRQKRIKVKGIIDDSGLHRNEITVSVKGFLTAIARLRAWFNAQPQHHATL